MHHRQDGSNFSRCSHRDHLQVQSDEIYNLGAQSHVKVPFDKPKYRNNITG
ncbi:GDP-mannose 4,6-dehydratase [Pseudothermotoga sp. U03pept]|uniref:GDP-mannose 4,6-dehydratase n=1 Tax=Pseudothermotoga sp. U03pept TaxID=3447012 RepID=UPI003EFD8DE4